MKVYLKVRMFISVDIFNDTLKTIKVKVFALHFLSLYIINCLSICCRCYYGLIELPLIFYIFGVTKQA